ncbi:unnamed protein product [Amoebophrya sp. A25]|nr:unnamed protein product [Amoebophrya sp. A25]|eukprot:GSA25T00027329001.1
MTRLTLSFLRVNTTSTVVLVFGCRRIPIIWRCLLLLRLLLLVVPNLLSIGVAAVQDIEEGGHQVDGGARSQTGSLEADLLQGLDEFFPVRMIDANDENTSTSPLDDRGPLRTRSKAPPIPPSMYDRYFERNANGNCSTSWLWDNSIISSRVGFHGLFWYLQNWCPKPEDYAMGVVEDKPIRFREIFVPKEEVDPSKTAVDVEATSTTGVADAKASDHTGGDQAGAPSGAAVTVEHDGSQEQDSKRVHQTTRILESALPVDDLLLSQYRSAYQEAKESVHGDTSLFCGVMPSCEPGSCLRQRGEDYEGILGIGGASAFDYTMPERFEKVLELCTVPMEGVLLPGSRGTAVTSTSGTLSTTTTVPSSTTSTDSDSASGSSDGSTTPTSNDEPPTQARWYVTHSPMDVIEKLGALSNLKVYGGYNGYSLEYMSYPLERILNQHYERRFPDRVWWNRGYECFLVFGSDRMPKNVVKLNVPEIFLTKEATRESIVGTSADVRVENSAAYSATGVGRGGGDETSSAAVVSTDEQSRSMKNPFYDTTAKSAANFLSLLLRERVIGTPARDSSNIWFRRPRPGSDPPFVSVLPGIPQNESSVEFYHHTQWRTVFADKVREEQRRTAEIEGGGVVATTRTTDAEVALQPDKSPLPQEDEGDEPASSSPTTTQEERDSEDRNASKSKAYDSNGVFVVNAPKVFSDTIAILASEWQNISHFTRLVIWLFELFTADWFRYWIEKENLRPFVLPTKFLQDFASLLPHNKFLLDVLFKHLTMPRDVEAEPEVEQGAKDTKGRLQEEQLQVQVDSQQLPPFYDGIEFCMYLDEPLFMDHHSHLDAEWMAETLKGRHCTDWKYDPLPQESTQNAEAHADADSSSQTTHHKDSTEAEDEKDDSDEKDEGGWAGTALSASMYRTDVMNGYLIDGYDYRLPEGAVEATGITYREIGTGDVRRVEDVEEIGATASRSLDVEEAKGQQPQQRRKTKMKIKFLAAALTTIQEIGYPSFAIQRAHDGISSPEALSRFRKLVWNECGIAGGEDETRRSDRNKRLTVLFMEKDGHNRQIKNLRTLVSRFREKYGAERFRFRRVRMSKLTPCEQIRAMHDAFVVIAMHGADITNTIFMRPNLSYVMEISLADGAPVTNDAGDVQRGTERWRCDSVKGMMYQEMEPWVFQTNQGSISMSWDRTQRSYAYKEVLQRRKRGGMGDIVCKRIGNDTIATMYWDEGGGENNGEYKGLENTRTNDNPSVSHSQNNSIAEDEATFYDEATLYDDSNVMSVFASSAGSLAGEREMNIRTSKLEVDDRTGDRHHPYTRSGDLLPSRRSMGYYSDFLRKAGITYDNLQIGVDDLPLDNPYDDFGEERFRGLFLTEEFTKRLALGRDRNLTVRFEAVDELLEPRMRWGLEYM